MIQIEGKQRGFGWILGRYTHPDLRYVYLEDYDAAVIQSNARIAELTTEVVDLKSKLDFANVMNADHDKTVAELTAEVIRLRQAHEYIAKSWPDSFAARESRSVIARNALKDGLL